MGIVSRDIPFNVSVRVTKCVGWFENMLVWRADAGLPV